MQWRIELERWLTWRAYKYSLERLQLLGLVWYLLLVGYRVRYLLRFHTSLSGMSGPRDFACSQQFSDLSCMGAVDEIYNQKYNEETLEIMKCSTDINMVFGLSIETSVESNETRGLRQCGQRTSNALRL